MIQASAYKPRKYRFIFQHFNCYQSTFQTAIANNELTIIIKLTTKRLVIGIAIMSLYLNGNTDFQVPIVCKKGAMVVKGNAKDNNPNLTTPPANKWS